MRKSIQIVGYISFILIHLNDITIWDKENADIHCKFKNLNGAKLNDTAIIEDSFIDSMKVGNATQNKVEISLFRESDSCFVTVFFYSKKNNEWQIQNSFRLPKDPITMCDVQISDFNGDGLNDVTYLSGIAARSSNELRNLFIYDQKGDSLIFIQNSSYYPNLFYNKTLNCIDSWMFHGGSSTVFLKINKNILKEFAVVHNDSHRTIYLIDSVGKQKLLQKRKIKSKDVYIRYQNFDPLKRYPNSHR